MENKLRCYVDSESPSITDEELNEAERIIISGGRGDMYFKDFDEYSDYFEYGGNFILTKNLVARELAVENMCCGIITKDLKLSNGETIYFAFDYGH